MPACAAAFDSGISQEADEAQMRSIDAVIFDVGGVLSRTGRPADVATRFPGQDPDVVQRALMGDYGADGDHPWHRLERGEISLADVRVLNRSALEEAGIEIPSFESGGHFGFEVSEPVVALVHDLKAIGIRLGVLTNNVREFRPMWWPMLPFAELFDDVIDSHEVGLRKPNPEIYLLALQRLGAEAGRTAFLDDVASNVEGARSIGIIGIQVDDDPSGAVAAVRDLAGLSAVAATHTQVTDDNPADHSA